MANAMFKNVNEKILLEFKAEAVREDRTFGQALNEALQNWVNQKRQGVMHRKWKLSELKPMDLGKGSEQGSTEVDRIVYK